MNILIIGSSGFVGRHLTPFLTQQQHQVTTLNSQQANLTQNDALTKLNLPAFDEIYHLAAYTQAGDWCLHHGGEQWIVNQQINTNVLAWWQQHQPQAKLIAFGTSVSYTMEDNLVETNYLQGIPNAKFYAYAMSKRMLLAGLQTIHQQYGLNYLYLIPSTIYGPQYHTDGRQLHFIYDLIRKIYRGKLYNEPVTLWGNGQQRRELVYIDDFLFMLDHINQICKNDIFNLGGGLDFSIIDFAKIICQQLHFDFAKIQFDTTQYVGAQSKIFNIDKLREHLPLRFTPIEEGIAKTIDWMQRDKTILEQRR